MTTQESNQGIPVETPYASDICLNYESYDQTQGSKRLFLNNTDVLNGAQSCVLTIISPVHAHGKVSVINTCQVTYKPDAGFCGVDSFQYYWAYSYQTPDGGWHSFHTNVASVQIQVGPFINPDIGWKIDDRSRRHDNGDTFAARPRRPESAYRRLFGTSILPATTSKS